MPCRDSPKKNKNIHLKSFTQYTRDQKSERHGASTRYALVWLRQGLRAGYKARQVETLCWEKRVIIAHLGAIDPSHNRDVRASPPGGAVGALPPVTVQRVA